MWEGVVPSWEKKRLELGDKQLLKGHQNGEKGKKLKALKPVQLHCNFFII